MDPNRQLNSLENKNTFAPKESLDLDVDNKSIEISHEISEEIEGSLDDGQINEHAAGKKEAFKDASFSSSGGNLQKTIVKTPPKIEVMIKETALAIENELKFRLEENKQLQKAKNVNFSQFNESVKRIRHLNGLLVSLKNMAKLTEEFVMELWRKFVK